MKGVEILSRKEIVTKVSFGWKLFWSLFVIYFIVFAIVSVWIWINKNDLIATIACLSIGIVAGVIFGYFAGIASGDPIDYITEYKVIFSDDVPMNEFMAKYEIVDQEGRIYTVREKMGE